MKDRLKKVLKRAASGLLAVLLAVCLVGTPRAKAVVSEGALLGSLFGSLLVSMGYSWAADNMDVPTFGESIYKLTQEFDEAMKDTGNQLIRDLSLAGLTANGAGKLQFGYAWVNAARSFAEWFQEKFFTSDVSTSPIFESSGNGGIRLVNGNILEFVQWGGSDGDSVIGGSLVNPGETYEFSTGYALTLSSEKNRIKFRLADNSTDSYSYDFNGNNFNQICVCYNGGVIDVLYSYKWAKDSFYKAFSIDLSCVNLVLPASLTAEKPQEVHYPDVAEDGSQVYEITVDGVTATDIEGIIQGAVDRILAGTAAIAGEVTQVGTGEIVENPEIDPYKVGLSSVFPFCIPFDVYNMVTMFVAEPEAPSAEWSFTLPWSNQEYSVGWDLVAFDGVARVCRDMELVLFAVGLAVITYKVIKW